MIGANSTDKAPALPEGWSPSFQRYFQLRAQADAVLAYQVGDCFTFFFEDAKIVAQVLGLYLSTTRRAPTGEPIPSCAVPADARFLGAGQGDLVFVGRSDEYFHRLVQAGLSVSVAVQTGFRDGFMQREILATLHPNPVR
jgi:DNA mismatch repair ATPase MutS